MLHMSCCPDCVGTISAVITSWPSRSSPAKMAHVSIFRLVFAWATLRNSETTSIGQITVRMPATGLNDELAYTVGWACAPPIDGYWPDYP